MDAYVICCNDSVTGVVIANEDLAEKLKDENCKNYYEKNKHAFDCFEDYKNQVFWHVKKVPGMNENSTLITEKRDYINLLCGVYKAKEKWVEYLISVGLVWRVYSNKDVNIEWKREELEKVNCEEIFDIYWQLTRD